MKALRASANAARELLEPDPVLIDRRLVESQIVLVLREGRVVGGTVDTGEDTNVGA